MNLNREPQPCGCHLSRDPKTGRINETVTSDHRPDCEGPAIPVAVGTRPDVDHEVPPPPVDWGAIRRAWVTQHRRGRRGLIN